MPLFGEIVVIKRNGTDGTHFPLTATSCLFGRKSECDIRIQLPHVSKEHCKVEVKANKEVFVINISAVNPTQLNGIAIQQPELLKHGDIITIIDRSFRFEQPPTNPHRQSTGGNSLSSKLVEDEPSSIKGKASKLTRKSEGNVSRTTHTRLSLPISPHRRSSREKKDLSPFGELYEMLKNKVHLKQEHAKTPAKQIMENGDCIFTPVTTRRSLGNVKGTRESSLNNTLQFESQELHVESATLSEKTASALKSPSRGRPSTKLKQQRLSGKRDSPAKSVSELPHEEISISFQDNGQKQPNDKLTPRRRRSTSKEQTPVKSGVSVLPLSRNRSPRSASPKDLHVNAQVSKPPQKRRSSELELPEPTPKRKRVSFGGHLSPEFFDKRLPPNSPLQRGATPSRRSLSLAATRVIRKSFGGFKQAVIKETFEPAKRSPGKASPAKRSPGKASPAKRSPAKASPAKMTPAKRSPAKASPAKMTPAKRSPAKASPAKITPAKRSPAKASPAKITPAKRSPAKASPAKITPAKRSPAKASPAKMTPAKRSPAKASPAKMTLAKRSPAKMTLAKQSPAKASPAKMTPAKRSPAKMTPAKRSPAKMTPAKRSPAKMTPAKRSPAKMTPAKRSPAKMTPAKRSPAKMTPAKRSPAKMTPAKRSPAKMTPAKRSPAKMTPAKRSPAKMTPAKMTPAKRSPAKMTPAKRSPAKMTPAKRSPAKMTPAKRSPAKMTPAKRSPARASPAKRSPARASPVKRSPARASPAKMTPAKRSPANVKAAKRSSAKMTPAKVTPAKKSPATIYSKGRFSISQTDTPPLNYVHVPNTEENELSAQTPRKSRKSISLKKTPGRRSRKLETFEILRSRRRSGATEANLLVAKSWADVVRIGVPKNHKKSEKQAHKAVPTKRKQKPKTPARRFIDRSGTGHADSPATILVGRAHTRTVNPTGYVPKIVQNQAIKIINDQNESFTGMSELFNTPAQVKPRKSGRSGGLQVNTPQALIVDVSLMQTPEELGEMVVSPINGSPSTTRKKQYSRDAVSRLLRSPVSPASPKGIEKISETSKDSELIEKETATLNGNHSVKGGAKPEKKKRETMGLTGVKRIMRTPKQKGKQVIDPVALKKMLRTPKQTQDMVGIKCILKTPKQKGMPVEDMAGIKRIMRTPKVKGNPVEDMTGIKHIMKTPKEKGQPVEDMVGVKRIMRTPKIKGQPVEDMVGIKRIMRTPKEKGQPVEDMEGLSQLMSTPTENTRPIEEIFGMKQLIKTPPKTTLVVRERASGTPPHSSKKAALFQTNQTSAPEEALPKHTTETNNGDVSLQIDSETGKSEKAKRRGRPSRASLNVALDGGKSVENNSTSAQEINMEEASPLHVLATEDTSSTGADKATPAKGRGRPSKGSMSKSPASANRDSEKNSTSSALEHHVEESSKESSLQASTTEGASSINTDNATPAKRRGRPSKRSLSHSPVQTIQTSAPEEALPKHTMETNNGEVSLQIDSETGKSETAKRRGRPSRASLNVALDGGKSVENKNTSAQEINMEEASPLHVLATADTSTGTDKATPAKSRGRPSKGSMSKSPASGNRDGGKSVENNSTSAQEINMEEASPLHVLATEDTSSPGTDKATPPKGRGRPSKGSMSKSPASGNGDSEKSEKNSTSSALENHVEESSKEASLQASTTEGASSTDADKTTPAKRRGRPSKHSLSHSPDGGKSVENNSTSAQEINMEEGAPLHVLATEDSSSTGTDKATPAKRRGRPSKGSMSKSPASANRDSEKSEKKSTSSALENHVEESSKEASLQASTTEGASSTDADKTTPAKRRGRPSKSSLSHSPVKPAVDVPEDLSTSNEDSNISELSSDIRTDQQKNVLPNGAKKATKKSQRKNTVTKETVQIAAVLQSEPLENLVVENDEKSAPQRRRGRPQKGGALSSATEVSDGVLAEELTTNRRTGRGRKIAEAAKLQEGLEVCTSAAESQVEVKNEELSSAKSLSKSSSPIKAVPEDSTTTKKLRGRQPKVGRERKAVAEKLLTELPGDSALVNNVTPSVRRGRRARGTANSVTETVIIETNLPDLADTVVLHEEQESSSHTSPEAKTQRGNRKNLKSAVDSVKNSAQTDVTIELKERAGKRPTRGARGTQQVEELKELKGKKADYHIPKNAEPVLLEETLAKEKASKAKSVQWHPLLAAQETAEKHTEETVKNLADEEALVSAIKSRGRRRQEVKETVVPAKRSRSRKEEKSVDTLNSSSVAVDEKSLALVASDKNEMSKTKRGRRQATIQLKKITDPDLPVAEVKNNSDVSSKQDLEPEIVSDKPLNRRNTGKRNLKSSSDSDSGSNAIEPALETMTQKRGRRGAAAKISDSENTEVKTVESAENLPSSKRRGRAPNKKNMPEISNVAAEPAESPENVAEIENTEKIESPPKSRRVLKRKAATTDVSEGNTSVSEKEAPAPVRGSTRGASRQKSAAKEKPVVVEESPAKRKKAVPSSSPTQKRGKTKATAVKRQNEKPAEVVKTRPTLRTRK
ncbi:marker of proliferation Ki-67 S homeolog isoform X2 [Xenopus laevis]|uniref:Marker of proliferation Ki-67 S homeolog isoform X2 n=1 Tax=Xenopus laevis TaxID=8355 RepID=A0A8J1L9N8_XENLA|nr:marker of proliferation Ki-67 S homeolog isoform X2 [Xenopus laevis]